MSAKQAKTPEQFLEEFCNTSKRIKIKGDPVKWYKKVLDEQHEEEYRQMFPKKKKLQRLK